METKCQQRSSSKQPTPQIRNTISKQPLQLNLSNSHRSHTTAERKGKSFGVSKTVCSNSPTSLVRPTDSSLQLKHRRNRACFIRGSSTLLPIPYINPKHRSSLTLE